MSGSTKVEIDLPADDVELREFTRIVSQALFFPGADLDAWVQREGRQNVRVARRDGRVEGYTVYAQKEADRTSHAHELELVDLVFLSPNAGRRLLTFLPDHRSMAPNVRWCGTPGARARVP